MVLKIRSEPKVADEPPRRSRIIAIRLERLPPMQRQLLFSRQTDWHEGGHGFRGAATASQQPTRRPGRAAWSDSDSGSPRHVTFAVQNVPPSPVAYQARQNSRNGPIPVDSPQEEGIVKSVRSRSASPSTVRPQRRKWKVQQTRSIAATRSTPRYGETTGATRTRRPGWDADVTHNATLFDASLKKSLLFRASAGDRKQELKREAQTRSLSTKDVVTEASRAPPSRRKKPPTPAPVRYRSGPSSVYAQHRQNTAYRPQSHKKDFMRQNIERLTGRSMDPRSTRRDERIPSRGNVFERLAAPQLGTSLHPVGTDEMANSELSQSPERSSLSSPHRMPSPTLMIDPPTPGKQGSIRGASPFSGVSRSPYSSPQRSQQSQSAPRSASTVGSRSGNASSRGRRQDNFPAKVFSVLDRDNEKRVGVGQILQGLRLLGLPATHNQIADYVYLIHEGRHTTIDLEEWEILVGTLDAASRPSSSPAHRTFIPSPSSRSPSLRSIPENSPRTSRPPSSSPVAMNSRPNSSPPGRRGHFSPVSRSPSHTGPVSESQWQDERIERSFQRRELGSAERQPVQDDDPYLEEIQNRIEGMFQRAEATAALRWSSDPEHNQSESHSRSDRILKRAATVVYSLRASLFPLVHQAEATLREIQQRHGSKLSLFLPPADLATIAQNSDVLASVILDDVLLDTIQLLNDEDRQQTYHQMEVHHADQLDAIMAHIEEIEQEENNLIQHGLALSYVTPGPKCDLQRGQANQPPAKSVREGGPENLMLPLEVVMNISVAGRDPSPPPLQNTRSVAEADDSSHRRDELGVDGLLQLLPQHTIGKRLSVKTAVLQGRRLQSIEKRLHKFQQHRRLVESSLAETGMAQFAVIELLESMLLDDLVHETAAELDNTVDSLSDTLLTSLL